MNNDLSRRHDLYEEVASLLAMHGVEVNNEVVLLMMPLLGGSVDYAEHQAQLEVMIRELEA